MRPGGESAADPEDTLAPGQSPGKQGTEIRFNQPGVAALSPGDQVGRFRIQSLLGCGGMGMVYRAVDERLQRDVAVKVLNDQSVLDRSVIGRFHREAKAVAGLAHPNIVALYDFIEEDGLPCAVMELLEGDTLEERLKADPLDADEFLDLATAVARGLACAHESGVVHRDIKPSNIFLTRNGGVKLLDFGLATARGSGLDSDLESVPPGEFRTQVGAVMGTVGYMSPEQVRGQFADARSDLFSLGVVLYEMATHTKAFKRGSPVETMSAILNDPLPDSARPELPRDHRLHGLISRCLAKAPEDRFQSARELLTALKETNLAANLPQASRAYRVAGIATVAAVVSIAAAFMLNRGEAPPQEASRPGAVAYEFQNQRDIPPVSRADFEELCAGFVGRWTAEATSVITEPDVAQDLEEVANYIIEYRLDNAGHRLTAELVSGRSLGSSTGSFYYNAATRQIRGTSTGSTGVVLQNLYYPEGDHWVRHTEQAAADGTIREFYSVLTLSADGNTRTIRIIEKNAKGEAVEQTNVWHRIGR